MTLPSKKKVTYDKVIETAESGDEVATIIDIVMDREFVETHRHDWCWLGSKNVPMETGWYRVNRETKKLEKIDKGGAEQCAWHERMYVYGSGHAAVRDDLPLALYIGDEYEDGRLSALYLCGPDVLTWVALKHT